MSEEPLTMTVTSEGNPELARALNRALTGNDEGGQMMEAAAAVPIRQLSFDVGGNPAERIEGSVAISGKLEIGRDLELDQEVEVHLMGPGGELLARGEATVNKIAFNTHRKADEPEWTERAHTVKLEAVE